MSPSKKITQRSKSYLRWPMATALITSKPLSNELRIVFTTAGVSRVHYDISGEPLAIIKWG